MSNKEHGGSLVETMIAMVLASFLSLVLLSTLYSTMSNTKAQRDISSLQQAERHVAQNMQMVSREAGYFVAPTTSSTSDTQTTSLQMNSYFPAYSGSNASFAIGQVVAGTTSSIDVRFQSALNSNPYEPTTINCLGESNGSATPTTYDNDFFINNTTHSLDCSVNGGTPNTIIGGGNYGGVQVQNMGVMYGVSTTGSESVNTYETSNNVSTNNQWNDVVSARITLDLAFSGQNNTVPFTFNLDFKGGTMQNALGAVVVKNQKGRGKGHAKK